MGKFNAGIPDPKNKAKGSRDPHDQSVNKTSKRWLTSRTEYFAVEGASYRVTGRPGNQNSRTVVNNVVERVRHNITETNMHDITRDFVKGRLAGKSLNAMSIDMSHGTSISDIMATLGGYMEAADAGSTPKLSAEDYAAGFITTDAEDEPDVRRLGRELMKTKSRIERIRVASRLASRMNRTRANLMGGDASTNRSIGSLPDRATMRNGQQVPWMRERFDLQAKAEQSVGVNRQNVPRGSTAPSSTFSHDT